MKQSPQSPAASLLLCVMIAMASACGTSSNQQIATQAELDECHTLCLKFGPEDCTRQCYATCDAEGGTCANSVAGEASKIHAMKCSGSTVNFQHRGGTLGCSPGRAAVSFGGMLPAGAWNSAKRMFVTSQSFRGGEIKQAGGMATGIASGDKICANLAAAANFGGTWKVWLSDSMTDAINRIAEAGPWYNTPRSDILFRSKVDLVAAPLSWQPRDEHGMVVPSSGFIGKPDVWTGTGKTGLHKAPSLANMTNCSNWTANTYMPFGSMEDLFGYSGSVTFGGDWSEFTGTNACSDSGHLYCFEQ